ncbi:RNA ligase family protein [Kitasatospora mediocidica]|uniref:RNA ligase family protein n=1 Tax=Kitasatospora mediocidica TaxID=58352 RepID=UPI000690EF4C|nr:RNA ligase family protein [Kitasatospora mediocidica]
MRTHYPRTPHLPWSPGATPDDVRAGGLAGLLGREVVVTEKLDGENTTLYPDGLHARSLDSAHHSSRAWVKALQGRIARSIPAGWRICGENLYARHSIAYDDLESWFYAFSVWDAEDRCLDWDETVRFTRALGVPVPPVLWRGVLDERAVRALRKLRLDTERQEGFVVRAAEGFGRAEFADRVAKWVRPAHVRTDTHWMHAAVVANGLRPGAALWDVRSGAAVDVPALLAALSLEPAELGSGPDAVERAEAAVADVSARLELLGRPGSARLAGVLAALLHGARRGRLMPRLVAPLGMAQARRVADLVGLHSALHGPFPDDERRAGLVRMAAAADLGVLHAVAAAVLTGRTDPAAAEAREQVEWSALHAEASGLLGPAPLRALRLALRLALRHELGAAGAHVPPGAHVSPGAHVPSETCAPEAAVADRYWAEALEGRALGRLSTAQEVMARGWRLRNGEFPRLVVMVGPSGSGKSGFARALPGVDEVLSLDDLREARGDRSDQRANAAVLSAGLERLAAALTGRRTVVWDATSLTRQQRSLVHAVAARRDALVTHAVVLVDEAELARRNAVRPHPVPAAVLAAQLARFAPPYPGQAHRTWYVGPGGTVDDMDGMDGMDAVDDIDDLDAVGALDHVDGSPDRLEL